MTDSDKTLTQEEIREIEEAALERGIVEQKQRREKWLQGMGKREKRQQGRSECENGFKRARKRYNGEVREIGV